MNLISGSHISLLVCPLKLKASVLFNLLSASLRTWKWPSQTAAWSYFTNSEFFLLPNAFSAFQLVFYKSPAFLLMHFLKSPYEKSSWRTEKKGKMRIEKMEFGSKKDTEILFHYLKVDEAMLAVEDNTDLPNSYFLHSCLFKNSN